MLVIVEEKGVETGDRGAVVACSWIPNAFIAVTWERQGHRAVAALVLKKNTLLEARKSTLSLKKCSGTHRR